MVRNRYNTAGTNFKKFTCAQTGEEVTRRKSLALDYRGDGKGGSPAAPCKRVKRELAPASHPLVYRPTDTQVQEIKRKVRIKVATKALSSKEKVQMKKLLEAKRNEVKKPT